MRPKRADPTGEQPAGSCDQARVGRDGDPARTRYEQLRAAVATGDPSGWRHGLGVLLTGGMVAWITAWATGVLHADAPGEPTSTAPTDPWPVWPDPGSHHEDGSDPARVSFPPGAATQIVRLLTQLTLPHTRLPIYTQEVVPP